MNLPNKLSICFVAFVICGSSYARSSSVFADVIQLAGIADDSNESLNKLRRAKELVASGDLPAAEKELNQLVERDKDLPHAELLLVQLLSDSGNAGLAEKRLNLLSKSEADHFEVSLAFARLAVQQKRWYDGWIHILRAEKAMLPTRWSIVYREKARAGLSVLKGLCAEGREDWRVAQSSYRAAGRTMAENTEDNTVKDPRVLIGMGRSAFGLNEIDDALEVFRQLRQLQPEAEIAELTIAKLFDQRGDAQNAERWYRRSLQDSERAEFAKLGFAQWLIWHNRPAEALGIIPETVADRSLDEQREYLSALAARMQGRYSDAQSALSRLHRSAPASFAISNQLALVLIESDSEADRGRALQIAESNVRNNQQLAEAWSTLGWVQLRLGDTTAAQKSLALATQSGQITRDTAHFIAELQEASGKSVAALEFRDAAAKASGPSFYEFDVK